MNLRARHSRPRRVRGFTLIELLVVMGVLLVLGVLTTISVRRVAREARLSTATNTVSTVLGTARALAMKNNTLVLVTFTSVWDPTRPDEPQRTEAVVAQWSGRTLVYQPGAVIEALSDLFEPVPGQPPRSLPAGIKVAGPRTDFDQDDVWMTQPQFSTGETARGIAVLFGPDGGLLSRSPNAASTADHIAFVDLNGDGLQDIGSTTGGARFFEYDEPGDEINLNFVQFLAVYDDDDARERYDVSLWDDQDIRRADLTAYITQYADRLHFNRYSGMVQR